MSLEAGETVGSVQEEELDSMLRLMCEAFTLPYVGARRIFYADPYFDLANKRVLRVQGRIVSCLTIVETSCWVGAGVLKMAGIAGVATLLAERRRGYAGRLLTETLSTLRERGYALAALIPYDYGYYRTFGWEMAGYGYRLKIAPTRLPAYRDYIQVRTATAEDIPGLEQLYHTLENGSALRCLRDKKRWEYLLTYISHCLVYAPTKNDIQGYLLYDLQEGRQSESDTEGREKTTTSPTLRILEMKAAVPTAQRGLLGYLARQVQTSQIEYLSDWNGLIQCGLLHPELKPETDPLANVEIVPSIMLRVVDLANAVESLSAGWTGFQGSLCLKMTDSLLPEGEVFVLVEGKGAAETCRVRRLAEADLPKDCPAIVGDVRVWSQVLVGHLGAAEAGSLSLLQPSSPQAFELAALLFPARTPFLPSPDHF